MILFCVLFVVGQFFNGVASAPLFSFANDNLCLRVDVTAHLTTYKLVNSRQCAVLCSKTQSCEMVMIVESNKTCDLYKQMKTRIYAAATYTAPSGSCRIGKQATAVVDTVSLVFTSNTTWTVPAGVTSIFGLCIGGGGGSAFGADGGGGSGNISYGTMNVAPGDIFNITIGSGGFGVGTANLAGASGGASNIGSFVVANGGIGAADNCRGAAGGSGGGGSSCFGGTWSANGGSSGADGLSARYAGGQGQGASLWSSALTAFANTGSVIDVTAGAGGAGANTTAPTYAGGGGGGGLVLNGSVVSGGNGSAPLGAGGGGIGYGGGAGAGGCSGSCYKGGTGADGVCIIVY